MQIRQMVLPLVGLAAFFSLASCADSQRAAVVVVNNNSINTAPVQGAPRVLVRGAESGKKQQFATFLSLNPDCNSLGDASVKVVTAPQHGQISIEAGSTYPGFQKENVRSACNTKQVPAQIAFYTSDKDFTGQDSFTLEVVYPSGGFQRNEYSMNVR